MEDHVCLSGPAILLISCHYRKPHCTFDLHMQSMLRLVYFVLSARIRWFMRDVVCNVMMFEPASENAQSHATPPSLDLSMHDGHPTVLAEVLFPMLKTNTLNIHS